MFLNYSFYIYLTLNISIIFDILTGFCEIISSNLGLILICEIIVLGAFIFFASRTTDKILRGLQGTAATTIIARGAYDAYNSWKNGGSSSNNDDSKDKDSGKDKMRKEENKPKPVPTVIENNKK